MAPAPRIGTEFAGYRIEGLLGRGGMGVVYRAEHPRLGATIALKVMGPELAMDETFRERFVREARAAARISHPNIIPIYDAGEWQGDLYIAMRYIEGDDLKSILKKNGALPTAQTQAIGLQIAGALDAAHRSGLLHRDVKPGNIMVERGVDAESPSIAYLADLGLTKHLDSHGGATGSAELLGTIDYIAPEQIAGSSIDGRADVYSLACVLFECLTGSVPYARENQAAVLWAHLHDEVPRATALNPSLTTGLDAVLARGLAKSPEDRFSTGRELVAALQASLEAEAATGPDESETLVARSSAGAATAAVPRAHAAPAPTARAPAPPARGRLGSRRGLALAAALGVVVGAGIAGAAFLLSDGDTAAPRTTPEERPATENTPASLSPFENQLLPHVPDELRPRCRHAPPLTDQFDATLSCPSGVVSSLTYSHARSGFHLYNFFLQRVAGAGLEASDPPAPTGGCSTGEIPAVNIMVPLGLSGRAETEERVPRAERLGWVLCYEDAGQARIEWMTSELGVYSIATSEDLAALYEWWRREAGPEP
jgi:pyruvate/2-oxoglutarate dehydrogenase complex dihydrolipoamide acyltransferase (E2) component